MTDGKIGAQRGTLITLMPYRSLGAKIKLNVPTPCSQPPPRPPPRGGGAGRGQNCWEPLLPSDPVLLKLPSTEGREKIGVCDPWLLRGEKVGKE